MRQNQNPRRSRGRINNGRNQNGKPVQDNNNQQNRRSFSSSSRQYESQGPDGKNRGTAAQLFERYTTLSREVISLDRTLAEAFSQFADHYYRTAAEAAGYEAETARNREVSQANSDVRPEGSENRQHTPQQNSHAEEGNNGNVAISSDEGSVSNGEDQQVRHARPPVDGAARDGGDQQWGNSRRRRAQNYRDARGSSEEAAPQSAQPSPEVVQPVAAAPEHVPAIVVETKPRRRLPRVTPKEDNAPVVEAVQPVQVEAAEPAKPRRGRPRKVVLTDESVA